MARPVEVDGSDHYEVAAGGGADLPSILAVIVDTNPRAWAALAPSLSIAAAIANLLVFINGHLALGSGNQVAVIAAHCDRAEWLYPVRPEGVLPPAARRALRLRRSRHHDRRGGEGGGGGGGGGAAGGVDDDDDIVMADPPKPRIPGASGRHAGLAAENPSPNKFPAFGQVESAVVTSLRALMTSTRPEDVAGTTTTLLSGALSLALAHINKFSLSFMTAGPAPSSADEPSTSTSRPAAATAAAAVVRGRIFVLSVSDSQPAQYIPTMNAVSAASHAGIPLDTLSLGGDAAFLQQAAFITRGSFVAATDPRGLLGYLMCGFAGDEASRGSLVRPSHEGVDFRAACFCHGRVVSNGFVCSICLSIFCEVPEGGGGAGPECLTCGTSLSLGRYGAKPAVIPRRRKKRKRPANGAGEAGAASNGISTTPPTTTTTPQL